MGTDRLLDIRTIILSYIISWSYNILPNASISYTIWPLFDQIPEHGVHLRLHVPIHMLQYVQ